MSGFEFLGAVASAAQLVDSGTKTYWWLAEIIRRVRDSPKELQLHAKSIQQLIETARLISYHFHASPELAEHLDSTLIEAENLRGIIQIVVLEYSQGSLRKRCWKAASGSKERKILSGLQKLEQEKSSLLLCLSSVNTKQLFSLQFSIDTLIEDMPKRTTVISGHTYRETEMEYKVSVPLSSFYDGELIIAQESTERDEASDEERSSQTTLVVANGSGNSAHGKLIQTFEPTVPLLILNRKLPPFLDLCKVQLVLDKMTITLVARIPRQARRVNRLVLRRTYRITQMPPPKMDIFTAKSRLLSLRYSWVM
jgi:hypothetical protein